VTTAEARPGSDLLVSKTKVVEWVGNGRPRKRVIIRLRTSLFQKLRWSSWWATVMKGAMERIKVRS
jgi:hypothetical protein